MTSEMSIEKNDQEPFTIVYLGNQSDKDKFPIEFLDVDQLKEFLVGKRDSSVIVILSDNIPLNTLAPVDLPQVCAVYNAKLVRLYCLPSMILLVNQSMKKISKQSSSSYILPLVRKYWFLIGLALAICLAYFFSNVGKTGGYIRSEWSVKWGCLMLIFFLNGLSLRTRQLAKEFLHIRLHIFVQIYSLLIIPFTIYGLALLLARSSLNTTLIVGLIIMASASTTVSSNVVMTKNAMGNEYAALFNAIVGNLLGIFVSPSLIFYFMKNPAFKFLSNTNNTEGQLDYIHVIRKLSLTVLLPLFSGQIIHLLWTKQVTYLREKLYSDELSTLALLAVVWAVFCDAFASRSFRKIEKKDLFILIIIDAMIYICFSLLIMIIARLPIRYWQFSQKDTVAIIFCGATKTLATGIAFINAVFENKSQALSGLLSLPLIIYYVEQLIIGAVLVILLRSWVKEGLKKQASRQNNNINIRSTNEDGIQTDELETVNLKS